MRPNGEIGSFRTQFAKSGTDKLMAQRRELRVYYGPDEAGSVPLRQVKGTDEFATVPLSLLIDTLSDAIDTDRTWLRDFSDEQISISPDLYEVLAAYRQLRRSA